MLITIEIVNGLEIKRNYSQILDEYGPYIVAITSQDKIEINEFNTLEEAEKFCLKNGKMSEEKKAKQIKSFAYENVKLHNPSLTKEQVEETYKELKDNEVIDEVLVRTEKGVSTCIGLTKEQLMKSIKKL